MCTQAHTNGKGDHAFGKAEFGKAGFLLGFLSAEEVFEIHIVILMSIR
jgi:hypothetical protein